ncbi:MAG TPA: hemerythrin domain-containing protein [Lacipirellulaceae bacterium]|nr:hemerythrin domain-containing protein [Lacipirellulaceae bacterium]
MPALNDSGVSTACMEHQVFEHIKQALLVTLNWQAPVVSLPRKISSLQFTIKSFQRHLDRVISIEEDGGYMCDAMYSKPYFQDRVEQLSKDHARFCDRLRKLIPMLNETKEWEAARFEQVCAELRSLITDVDRHNEREIELLQESALVDEGGEG